MKNKVNGNINIQNCIKIFKIILPINLIIYFNYNIKIIQFFFNYKEKNLIQIIKFLLKHQI